MPNSYDQHRGRSEYRTRYSGISAYDGAHQSNYNSAGDRRSYRNRSVSRDHTHRSSKQSRKHGGNIFTLFNVSHNSIVSPSRDRSSSNPPNRHLARYSNDGQEQKLVYGDGADRLVDEIVRIEQTEITAGHHKKEKHRSRRNYLEGADTPDNQKRNGKGAKTRLIVTAMTAIVSVFVIANSLSKRGPSHASRSRSLHRYRDHSSLFYHPFPTCSASQQPSKDWTTIGTA
ncbi:hypothetical protein BDZ45DRAFT_803512, partial [Acephala macrosclerotiorum]